MRPFSNPSQADATASLSPPTAPLPLSDSSLEEYSLGSSFGTVSGSYTLEGGCRKAESPLETARKCGF